MRLQTCLGVMLILASLLQGCGRKGPLTMPVPDAQKAATTATPQSK